MKSMRWLALVAVAALLAGPMSAEARQRGKGRGKAKQPAESIYDQLVRECKLTAGQEADVKAKIKARDDALAAWDKANGDKMQAAEAASKEARSGGDADAKKKASSELRALKTAREESAAAATAAILTVLTDEQKTAWAGFQLFQSVSGRYRKAELTAEQVAKIKGACAIAAKELGEVDENDSKAKKAKGEITKKLQWAINALVLTAEQRAAVGQPGRGGGRKAKDQQ